MVMVQQVIRLLIYYKENCRVILDCFRIMKRILQIGCENFGRGGRSVVIYNLTEELSTKYVIDFLSTNKISDKSYIDKLKKRNASILEYIPKYKNKLLEEIYRFYSFYRIMKDRYDIVHINADDAWEAMKSAFIAKFVGISKIVIHAHTTNQSKKQSKLKLITIQICQQYLNFFTFSKVACSVEAAQYMFGSKNNVRVIENGIHLEKYKLSSSTRNTIRNKLGLDNKFVVGTIGRISTAKNPQFILDVIQLLSAKVQNFKFLWVGDGELSSIIKGYAKERGLDNYILFLGGRDDIPELLMGMDSFILPSLYEGFGIVNIEAQASGLPCFVSDSIPSFVKVNPNFYFLSLRDGAEMWADMIIQNMTQERIELPEFDDFRKKGFDIYNASRKLDAIYQD